jgi:arylsulfatase
MAKRYGIESPHGFFQGGLGQERVPVGGMSQKELVKFEKESFRQLIEYVKDPARDEKPFFIYWPTYANQLAGVEEYEDAKYVDAQNPQASFMAMHDMQMGELLQTLEDEGIAENTLVVWISDNGPAYYWYPNAGFSYLRGGKGDVLEGGVRVPAMAWWPGMIEPGQEPLDMIHITDLFTTAARLGGALDNIPSDRVTDGIDQTALLLNGEGHGRRHYIMHYTGNGDLGAARLGKFKLSGLN